MPDDLSDFSSTSRRLVVCADDLGLNDSINEAILALAKGGGLNAASVMSEGRISSTIMSQLKTLPIELGLHLNFTQSFPDEVPGVWRGSLGKLIVVSYLRGLSRDQVRLTIESQLDRFEEIVGRPPAYIDGHQHVHQFPVIRDILLESLGRRYPGLPIWLRSTCCPARSGLPFAVKAAIIEVLGGRALLASAARAGRQCSHRLVGVYDFRGGLDDYLSLLETWVSLAEDGDVLFCHPATMHDPADVLGEQRKIEYQALQHPRFAAALKGHGFAFPLR